MASHLLCHHWCKERAARRLHTRHSFPAAVHASQLRWSSRLLRCFGSDHSTALQSAPCKKLTSVKINVSTPLIFFYFMHLFTDSDFVNQYLQVSSEQVEYNGAILLSVVLFVFNIHRIAFNILQLNVRVNLMHTERNFQQGTTIPGSKVHGTNMGPIWGRQAPGGPHVDPMNFANWGVFSTSQPCSCIILWKGRAVAYCSQ